LGARPILLAIVLVLGFGWLREIVLRPTEPAATVGDQVISVGQLVQRVKPQLAAIDNEIMRLAMQAPQGASTSATDTTTRQLQSLRGQRSNAPDMVLTDMIDEELVRLEMEKRGVAISQDEITARLNSDLAKQQAAVSDARAAAASGAPAGPELAAGPTPTPTKVPTLTTEAFDTAYADFLGRINYSDEQYRAYVESMLQKEKLRDILAATLPTTQEQVHTRRLTVATQEEATAALAQIRSGERTLADLAQEKSIDLLSKSNAGDLGWMPRGIDSPQFDDTAFRISVGEISDPYVSPQGWEIIELLGKETRPVTDEQMDRLKARVMDQWMRDARESPTVRRDLSPEKREWVMRQSGAGRSSSSNSRSPLGF